MSQYLGVTTNAETEEIEICCASETEAHALATELSAAFVLSDENKPKANSFRITYYGNMWFLKNFLARRHARAGTLKDENEL